MNENNPQDLDKNVWSNSLAFFGAITASVSHELNNVMSIIDQNNGLLSDLLIGAQYGRPITNERLERISNSITNQMERGVKIIKRLNTFAHSVDDPVREFDLIQLVDNFTRLAQRLANLKKTTLESVHEADQITVNTSPFLVQQIMFLCIQRTLNAARENDVIEILTKPGGAKVAIEIHARWTPTIHEGWDSDYVEHLIRLIDGNLEIRQADEKEIIVISVGGVT